MKKIAYITYLLCGLIFLGGCSNNVVDNIDGGDTTSDDSETIADYEYEEGVYFAKNWEINPADNIGGNESNEKVPNKESAISIAVAEFEKIQANGICGSYVLKGVFLDTEDHVWVVWFAESTAMPGSCYNIAISQRTGAILDQWPGE